MNTSRKKIPWLYIGLIAFLAIAALGIVYDFISKSGGVVSIISVIVAFLILAAALVIDTVLRKKAAAEADDEGWTNSDDNRFLRHTEDMEDDEDFVWRPNISPRSGFAGFNRRKDAEEKSADESFGPAFDTSAFESETSAAAGTEFNPDDAAGGFEDNFDGIDDISDDEVYSFTEDELGGDDAPDALSGEPEEQPEEDDPFRPVLRLNGTQQEEAAPQEEEAQPAEELPADEEKQPEPQPEEPAVPAAAEPAVQEQPAAKPAAAERVPAPAAKPVAADRAPAAMVVPAASVGGQTIESFYDEMSEEDILYRDCVEVWAADAKPAALRLIKYVEGIEDKQTAALIGREVEYVNAMIDRINCFTQLEYIDELLEYREHNYSTLVKDCLKRFSPFFMEKRLGLLWKGLDIDVMTDRRWFIFALTQVIFNAVEFTPTGGKIAISAKKHDEFIDLTVEDSGKGIAAEELPFVFMAGYMGDDAPNESGRRTGMGLFIAQSVMRKMGGDMLAESTPGKGTRITMRMPIIEPQA